ncbi:platelet glycoprotein Ib alpha chain-like [Myripristis murdjan]|uniref:platelet glycoprotein Ib alpha chain-like n=1 Tax=Myripristis murdjan TaxID=586833 RepID=UPI001175F1FF|nr:platelet glycoprotein Ib alpha chain-like [Myripristis murdjan]
MKPFLLLLCHVAVAMAVPGCHSDRDRYHRPRENCTAGSFTDIPAGLEPTTQVLLFPQNQFSSLSWSSYQVFTEIYEIDLTGNKVSEVTPSEAAVLPSLRVLQLGSNQLTSLPAGGFSACPDLIELHLHNNAISSLSDDSFTSLSKLEILDLSSNHITVLPALMLRPLSAIEALYIESNKIKVMPDDWFSPKEEVPYLFLSANPWACSCSLGYLRKYLDDYDYNVYTRDRLIISPDAESVVCDSPPRLKGTPVVSLEESDFCSTDAGPTGDVMTTAEPTGHGCHSDRDKDHRPRENCTAGNFTDIPAGLEPTTQVLLFPQNQFSSLSWSSYQVFTEIYEIDLTGNKVSEVTPSEAAVLPSLRVLRLGSNQLTSLPAGGFSTCPDLIELHLHNNAISSLSDDSFTSLSKLEILDLSSNHITVLPALMLRPLSAIETLCIERNKIKVMPDDWFSPKKEVPYLFLSANPWACSCSLGYLRTYLDEYDYNVYTRDSLIITSDAESVVCDSPPRLKGTPVVSLEESDFCSTDAGPRGDVMTTAEPATTATNTTTTTASPSTTAPKATTVKACSTKICTWLRRKQLKHQ